MFLRNKISENSYMLDGVDEDMPMANNKTKDFVEKYGVDAADELIEFIITDPSEIYFSQARENKYLRSGKVLIEEDCFVLKRYSPLYGTVVFMKVFHFYSNSKRTVVVHPY